VTTLIETCTLISNSTQGQYHDLLHQNIFDSLTRKIDTNFGNVRNLIFIYNFLLLLKSDLI
jgi:hypothetical protein